MKQVEKEETAMYVHTYMLTHQTNIATCLISQSSE